MRMRRRAWLAAAALLGAAGRATAAGLNAALRPLVLQPAGPPAQWEFDLTAAQARARAEGKWLYLYLGADNCPYCRRYEAFVDKNAAQLAPHFAKYLVVDLRSNLSATADKLFFRVGGERWGYVDFQKKLGDERARMLVYPSVWLLDASLKPLMQMPAGTGTFETVDEQIEVLRLQQ